MFTIIGAKKDEPCTVIFARPKIIAVVGVAGLETGLTIFLLEKPSRISVIAVLSDLVQKWQGPPLVVRSIWLFRIGW